MKSALLAWSLVTFTAIACVVVIATVVVLSPNTGGATDYRALIIKEINRDSIKDFLRNLTVYPHPAGSSRSFDVAQTIQDKWKEHGLNEVKILKYNVYLSRADPENVNYFQILDSSGDEVHASSPEQPDVDEYPQKNQEDILSFNAFSANGEINATKVYYANYGTEKDFKMLEGVGAKFNDSIVIIRYGKIFRGDKVRMAAEQGASGVILYSDPADVAPLQGNCSTYPYTVYSPPGGVQLGSLVLQGDLLTPGYPANDYAFRIPESEADMPKIPVLPVSYDDAYHIISLLGGDEAPQDWQGGLDVAYKYGDLLVQDTSLFLSVSNVNERQEIYNVIGSLKGLEEPDRYVLLGNHHDALGYGGMDPSSATANMLELTRVLGKMYQDGWRPRRTLVFCSWDAGESGVIGSTEYAEQFRDLLKDRAVVYLNVDMVMGGNYSFGATGMPQLSDIIYESVQMVPNPDSAEVDAGRAYLYDTWLEHFPDGDSDEPSPVVGPLGTGSDYRAFLYNLGIPSLDLCFLQNPNDTWLPLYHMAYETYELATDIMDVGLYFHEASARVWGLLAYEFSARYPLPINVIKLSQFVVSSVADFKTTNDEKLRQLNVTMDVVGDAADRFSYATKNFWDNLQNAYLRYELTLRRYNDAMMLMDRAFLANHGIPGNPNLNHVLVAPNVTNGYVWETFPGLQHYLRNGNALYIDATRRGFREHSAVIAYHLDMASKALDFDVW